jgi:hypothetical protein
MANSNSSETHASHAGPWSPGRCASPGPSTISCGMLILRSRLLCPKTQDPSALEVTSSLKLQLFKRYVYPCFCQLPSRPAGRRASARRLRASRPHPENKSHRRVPLYWKWWEAGSHKRQPIRTRPKPTPDLVRMAYTRVKAYRGAKWYRLPRYRSVLATAQE